MRILIFALLFLSLPFSKYAQSENSVKIKTHDTLHLFQLIQEAKVIAKTNPDSAVYQLKNIFQRSNQAQFLTGKVWSLIELTHIKLDQGSYNEALKISLTALTLCDTSRHKKELSYIYINIGSAYYNTAHFEKAFQANLRAQRYASIVPRQLAGAYNNQANILRHLQQPQEALDYNQKALNVARQHHLPYIQAMQYINMANGYMSLQDTSRTLLFYDSAITLSKTQKFAKLLDFASDNKAIFLLQLDSADYALAVLKETEPYLHNSQINRGIRYKAYGIIYSALAQYSLAKTYLDSAAPLINAVDSLSLIQAYYELYTRQKHYEKALEYHVLHRALSDTAQKYEVQSRISELNIQYQTAEKDKEIAGQKLVVAQQQNRIQQNNNWILTIGSAALLISLTLLYLYRNSQQKRQILAARQENLQLKALMQGEEKERKRLSAELHDGIGGLLSAAKMSFSDLYLQQPENEKKYRRGIGLLDEAYTELRNTAHNLSPEMLQSQGLTAATEAFCQNIAALHKMDIRLRQDGDFDTLSPELALNAYRIIQELLHNAVKHSRASQVGVQLRNDEDGLYISVEDNGIGLPETGITQGIGLYNLQHRIEAFKGSIELDSRPGEGTTIYIRLG